MFAIYKHWAPQELKLLIALNARKPSTYSLMACASVQVSATGHYVLSFVTTSEMEIRTVTFARSRPARGEFSSARAVANGAAADMFCFAEFVILMLWVPTAH
jgi:hypothetical protein